MPEETRKSDWSDVFMAAVRPFLQLSDVTKKAKKSIETALPEKARVAVQRGMPGLAPSQSPLMPESAKKYLTREWQVKDMFKPGNVFGDVLGPVKRFAVDPALSGAEKLVGLATPGSAKKKPDEKSWTEIGVESIKRPFTNEQAILATALVATSVAAYKGRGKIKLLNRPIRIGGININRPLKRKPPVSIGDKLVRAGSRASIGALPLGATLLAGDALINKRPDTVSALAVAKDKELETRRAVEGRRAEEREYSKLFGYKPMLAAGLGGAVGGLAGYLIPEKNKLLWSMAGGASGALAPLLIGELLRRRGLRKKAQEKEKTIEKEPEVVEEPAVPEQPAKASSVEKPAKAGGDTAVVQKIHTPLRDMASSIWERHKYDIGAGLAAGAGIGTGIKGLVDPENRWWWLGGSGGLFGLSYLLAREGARRRGVPTSSLLLREGQHGPHGRLREVRPALNKLFDMVNVKPENRMSSEKINELLWELSKVEGSAKTPEEARARRSRMINKYMQPVMGQTFKGDPKTQQAFTELTDQMMEATSKGANLFQLQDIFRSAKRLSDSLDFEKNIESEGVFTEEELAASWEFKAKMDLYQREHPGATSLEARRAVNKQLAEEGQ